MRRIPELDSLRAIAAVVVLFFHLDPLGYFPGWSGVDLFFVLSGYLITTIILRHEGVSGFYKNFYVRRTLRIWPIYYLVVLGLVVANRYLTRPSTLADLAYELTYTQHTPLYRGKQPPPNHPALNHTWTLAIEEQFYLVWPALVLWAGRRRLAVVCLIAIAIALATRAGGNCLIPRYPERLLVSRCDGFALGGLLAWLLDDGGWARRRPDLGRRAFGSAAGAALGYLVWGSWAHGPVRFIGLPTPMWPAETIFAFGVLYAGIIGLVVLNAGCRLLRPLRARWLAYLGQISYGLYLYHYVVFWVLDGADPEIAHKIAQPRADQAIKLGATLLVAVASWHLIERPILTLKDRFRYRDAPPGTPSPEPDPADAVSTDRREGR